MVGQRSLSVLVITVATLLMGCDAMKPPAFERFTSKAGRFSVMMPGKPKKQTQNVPSAVGNIKMDVYSVDRFSYAYLVMTSDMPTPRKLKDDEIRQVLNDARDGALGQTKGKLVKETEITIDGYIGKEIEITAPEVKGMARNRMYWVDGRLYQVMVVGPKSTIHSDDTEKFYASFKLTGSNTPDVDVD